MEKIYQTIDTILKAQKKARQNKDYLTLMLNGEALLEYLPELINYSVDSESSYRKYEAKLSDEYTGDKRNSSAYCDAQAKAQPQYQEWQRAKNFIELIYEIVNMSKKLAGGIDSELRASK